MIAIILNGISKKKKFFYKKILPPLQLKFQVTVVETEYAGHATELAAEWATKSVIGIIAAGGDGTLHQVLNGLLSQTAIAKPPSLGVIPLGSGNDFATACGLTTDIHSLIGLLEANSPRATDIGKITCHSSNGEQLTRYFINVCSVGMGPNTVQYMEQKPKWLGSDLRYIISIMETFFTHQPEPIEVSSAHWNWKGLARVFAIANGKSFGNKIYIAPKAQVDDGLFNTFLAGDIPLLKFLFYLQTIKGKKEVIDTQVTYSEGEWFELRSPQKLMLEAEGELVGFLPARIELLEKKINFFR